MELLARGYADSNVRDRRCTRLPELDLDDIQGLIARGYVDLKAASYVLLRIDDAARARAWLGEVADEVTPGLLRPPDSTLNLAVTASGLRKLGLSSEAINQFSNGDVGPSAPEQWLWGGPSTPAIDLLVLLFARDEATLTSRYDSLKAAFAQEAGVSEVFKLDSVVDLDGKEHFGFADGISQPTVDGLSSRTDIPPNTVQPGEFILGYVNEYGHYTDRPLLDAAADPAHVLQLDAAGSGKVDFARNGSYIVFRQLSQDVRGFWQFVDSATRQANGSADPRRRTWLAAKMVGRWPSGAPLTLTPDADDPSLASANDFTYYYGDEFGLNCPIASHVRRSHPRDSLDPDPGSVNSVALDKHHRLLRRGREYGPPVGDVLGETPTNDADRGLYFICVAANISRQFEFVQHTWINNPTFDGLYDEADPLVASHAGPGATFSIPADPVRQRYKNLPRFVTVRGGGYFFLPGVKALRYLASLSS
jgi:Dyp-type peroxidase family